MVFISALLLGILGLPAVLASPQGPASYHELLERQQGNSYFSSYWSDGGEKVNYKNLKGGEYSITWSGTKGNFVAGQGWNKGSAR